MLLSGLGSVRIVKNCDLGLENAALGLHGGEIHYNDRRIPEEYFRKQLRMNRRTFDMLLNVLRPAVLNTRKYKIA